MIRLNVGCGPHRARSPWVNVDRVHIGGEIEPDIVNPSGLPADLIRNGLVERASCTHIYMGHLLEHVPWDETPEFLESLFPLLAPGGEICVVCPDVHRVVEGYKDGRYPWSLVVAAMEGPNPQIDNLESAHDGARHQWNATEERVRQAVEAAGFADVQAVRPRMLDGVWPLVSPVDWQCAVTGRLP
jgi:hypothetical protein